MENNMNNSNATENTETTGVEQTTTASVTEEKTYTQAELDAFLQQETDRRVTAALKKQQKKFEAEKSEAAKLATMNEEQRKEFEFNKKVEEFEQREREFNIMQNKLSATKVMSERGLPVNFVDYIVAEDAETMMDNINSFESAWKSAIADAVSARLGAESQAPKSKSVSQTGLSSEEFKKLSVAQQSEIYKTNPELYKQLTQR